MTEKKEFYNIGTEIKKNFVKGKREINIKYVQSYINITEHNKTTQKILNLLKVCQTEI